MTLTAFIESIALVGPGLIGWPHAADVLSGRVPYVPARTELPPPAGLSVRIVDAFVDRLDTFAQPLVVEAERMSGDARSVLYGFALRCGDRVLLSGRAAVMLDASAAGVLRPSAAPVGNANPR